MKKLLLPVLLGLAAVITAPSHALTTTGGFDVTVNLYPKCEFVGGISALVLNYTAGGPASSGTTDFTLKCTNGIPYTFSFGGTGAAAGTLAGIAYSLSTVETDGSTGATGANGSGANQSFKIRADAIAGQAGDCAGTTLAVGQCSASTTAGVHTLVVSY